MALALIGVNVNVDGSDNAFSENLVLVIQHFLLISKIFQPHEIQCDPLRHLCFTIGHKWVAHIF